LIAVKDGSKPEHELAEVLHSEMIGSRRSKFDLLESDNIHWEKLTLDERFVYFKPTGIDEKSDYKSGISVTDIFNVNSVGIAAGRDSLAIARTKEELISRLRVFTQLDEEGARKKFNLRKDARDWQVKAAQADVGNVDPKKVIPITYRPFDPRWTYYTGVSKGFHCYPRQAVSEQFREHDNLALCFTRRIEQDRPFADVLVSENVIQFHSLSIKESNYIAPLYVWDAANVRHPNFRPQALRIMSNKLSTTPEPRDLLAYIYGVLSDPQYRSENDASLRLDYPRVPIPENDRFFENYKVFGNSLIELHTMTSSRLDAIETTYPIAGSNHVEKYEYRDGQVWINENQYFGNVPQVAWDYVVGSYAPALKWLKDRKGTDLSRAELVHYQKLIRAAHLSVEESEGFQSPFLAEETP
ncbi:type ISP restriction/modification enzyme, partial [Arthrobacter sp. LAPM80]|uniref:type ISP restriction/modification enzyme n=1 Tax=Arthrobacter sp. LAPM80 TaxID=3141788 RepID=UPI00398B6529